MEEQVLEDSQGARLEPEREAEESGPSTGALHSEETSVGSAAEAETDRENAEEEVWCCLRGEVARLLQEVGYTGPLLNEDNLARSTSSGASCQQFTSLCAWLVSELKAVASLEENISPTEGPEDAETFQLEMSGVVNELHCPYTSLTTGDVTRRLTSPQNCLQLLVFLSTELQAAQILKRKEVSKRQARENKAEVLQELHLLCKVTGLPEPSLDAPVAEFMKELDTRISDIVAAASETAKSPPLLTAPLEPEQWETLKKLHDCMVIEYERRMRMLVTRLDVTVKSFHWSERAKEQGTAMDSVFWPLRQALPTESRICLSNILAARKGDSRILHTCSASFCQNTRSAVNKVMMMGTVPDRGGRPNEIEPPMPTWEKRREGGGGGHQRWEKKNKKRKR